MQNIFSQLPQVGTCVTTSFTEWNLHPEKSAMVPTVKKELAEPALWQNSRLSPSQSEMEADRAARDSIKYAIQRINSEIAFSLCKVPQSFNSSTAFSKLDLKLAAHNDGVTKKAVQFTTLFGIDPAEIHISDAVKFLHRCKRCPWPPPPGTQDTYSAPPAKKRSESSIMMDISTEILQHLCIDVTLESRYAGHPQRKLGPSPVTGITCEDIGIGTIHTWHGSPDGRVRGGATFVCKDEDEDSDEDDDSDNDSVHSDGRTTAVEAKIASQLPQVVGTCVTTSFTERNLHPEKSAMVPTVLIGEHSFRACLYDCEKDILIISSKKCLSTKGHLSRSAMVLLWAIFNHRDFLLELPAKLCKYPSGIKAKLEWDGALPHYLELTRKYINWDVARTEFVLEGDELPVSYGSYLPAPKRRKE